MQGFASKITQTSPMGGFGKYEACNKGLRVKSWWVERNMNHPARQRSD